MLLLTKKRKPQNLLLNKSYILIINYRLKEIIVKYKYYYKRSYIELFKL